MHGNGNNRESGSVMKRRWGSPSTTLDKVCLQAVRLTLVASCYHLSHAAHIAYVIPVLMTMA